MLDILQQEGEGMRLLKRLGCKNRNTEEKNSANMPKVQPGAVTKEDLGVNTVAPNFVSFKLKRSISEGQQQALRAGHIGNMDDKWSWFMEGDALFICRSWTNNTVFYRIDLSLKDMNHGVAVLRNMKQDLVHEKYYLNLLLNSMIGPSLVADEQEEPPTKLEYTSSPKKTVMTQYKQTSRGNVVAEASIELASAYTVGDAFILENSDHMFQRIEYDKAQNRHVFQMLPSMDEITVIELHLADGAKKIINRLKPSDKLLLLYLMETDTSLDLPKGRKIEGEIETKNGITYASSNVAYHIKGKRQPVSAAVYHGYPLLLFGNTYQFIAHLHPAE